VNDDDAKLKKHSVLIAGHATSISIEGIFWQELTRIAEAQNKSLNALITEIDETRPGNLSSALRVFVLRDLKINN